MTNLAGWRSGGMRAIVASSVVFVWYAMVPAVAQDRLGATNNFAAISASLALEPASVTQAPESSASDAAPQASPSSPIMGLRPEPISHELSFDERVRIYRASVFSPTTVAMPAFGAAIDQWQDEPTEWEQGMAGYGRRLGSGVGKSLANKTIIFGVAALDGEDPRYFRSDSSGLASRARHAVVSAFVSYAEDGSRMPAYAHFAGAYGSAFVAMTWYPPSKSTTQHAMVQGTTKLGLNAAMNLLREFWPDVKRRLHFGQ